MNATQAAELIGRHAVMTLDAFSVPVVVSDVRIAFGRIDYAVTPIGGSGTAWVAAKRVDLRPLDAIDALCGIDAARR